MVWIPATDDVADDVNEDILDEFEESQQEDSTVLDIEHDQESLAIERMSDMVSQLMLHAQQLIKRKQALQTRIQKLEEAKAAKNPVQAPAPTPVE